MEIAPKSGNVSSAAGSVAGSPGVNVGSFNFTLDGGLRCGGADAEMMEDCCGTCRGTGAGATGCFGDEPAADRVETFCESDSVAKKFDNSKFSATGSGVDTAGGGANCCGGGSTTVVWNIAVGGAATGAIGAATGLATGMVMTGCATGPFIRSLEVSEERVPKIPE